MQMLVELLLPWGRNLALIDPMARHSERVETAVEKDLLERGFCRCTPSDALRRLFEYTVKVSSWVLPALVARLWRSIALAVPPQVDWPRRPLALSMRRSALVPAATWRALRPLPAPVEPALNAQTYPHSSTTNPLDGKGENEAAANISVLARWVMAQASSFADERDKHTCRRGLASERAHIHARQPFGFAVHRPGRRRRPLVRAWTDRYIPGAPSAEVLSPGHNSSISHQPSAISRSSLAGTQLVH